jgi:hypothetical protein
VSVFWHIERPEAVVVGKLGSCRRGAPVTGERSWPLSALSGWATDARQAPLACHAGASVVVAMSYAQR